VKGTDPVQFTWNYAAVAGAVPARPRGGSSSSARPRSARGGGARPS